ncbi:MAG: aromatic-ring-hydroxylating dioxygenase subunit beta [Rhodospirillales bacterium]|nr:aromatic-ring-hydroxylating dioxygenase subunit beta [Rhodospirillales bacterium]
MDREKIEDFLIQEARLLDERRFEDWLALYTRDCWYWVPLVAGQDNPHDTVSLMYDDRRLLETRIRRFGHPNIHAQEPLSRTSHIIANVTIEKNGPGAAECIVRSKFHMIEYRRDKQRIFGGTCLHGLTRENDEFQIRWKRVDLVNSESIHDGLSVPF